MASDRSNWVWFDLGIKEVDDAWVDTQLCRVACALPFGGRVMEVWVGSSVLVTTGTVAFNIGNQNPLAAATVDIAALTTNIAAKQTLNTVPADLRFAAGNILVGSWTLTNITVGAHVALTAMVAVEPDIQ